VFKQAATYFTIATASLTTPAHEVKPEMCKNEGICDSHNNPVKDYNKEIDKYWNQNLPPNISNGIIPFYQ
jgi:hypothetical protein